MSTSGERLLFSEIRAGNKTAFSDFYKQYVNLMHRFVIRYVKSHELADDLVQEIFIKIWENRTMIPDLVSLKSYLFIIARNHTFTFLKKASAEQSIKERILSEAAAYSNTTEDLMLSAEYNAHLQHILSKLPPQTQKIFKLCREEEKSYQEVSALLGISKDAVKKHMVRSMKLLKPTIDNGFDLFISVYVILNLFIFR